MLTTVILVADRGPSVVEIETIARHGAGVVIDPPVMARLARNREVLDAAVRRGVRVYGYNTGLGAKSGLALDGDPLAFQPLFLRGRDMAVGEPLRRDLVRAAVAARIGGLAADGSGLSPRVFTALVTALNAGVHPVIRQHGSVGASDLCLLAPLGRMLIGEGDAEWRGGVMPSADALAAAGLAPVVLDPKDGLSLTGANAVSTGHAALVVADAGRLLDRQIGAVALTMEGLGANPSILDPRLQAARPAPGQAEVAGRLRDLVAGSGLGRPGVDLPLQDPLSVRCAPSILGAASAALDAARRMVELELGAAADNPLVLPDTGEVLSTGNFHAPALALAFEALGLALAQSAIAAMGRFILLTGGTRNGLPRALSRQGGAAAGFVPLQKTAAALVAAIRHAAQSVVLEVVALSEGVEDHATQAPLAVEKCARIVELYTRLVAIEMMAGAEATDLRDAALGEGTAALKAEIRTMVAPLDEDRALGAEAEALALRLLRPPSDLSESRRSSC